MRQLTLLIFGLLLLTTGCSKAPTLDASTDEDLKRSLEKMTEGMSQEEKEQFGQDCMTVVLPEMMSKAFSNAFKRDMAAEPSSAEMLKPLDGLTVAEIHAKAEVIRAGFKEKSSSRTAYSDPGTAIKSVAESPEPVEPKPTWTPSSDPVNHGDLQIRIVKASLGKVTTQRLGGDEGSSKDDLLMVELALSNVNPTKKVEYRSWGGDEYVFGGEHVKLTDNFDNTYKRVNFGYTTRPKGAVLGSESIYPTKSLGDVLVFEIPINAATHLNLELPAKNYGGEGMIRFRIPVNSVARLAE